MLFAYSTDDRSLIAFKSEADAVAYAEGIDVEEGIWLFYAEDGRRLEPVFTKPNERGSFTVLSGQYFLRASQAPGHLRDVLENVVSFAGEIRSRKDVERVLRDR